MKSLRFLIFIGILYFPWGLKATHNRAGEISFVQLNDLTIRATVTTYTKASSTAADRDSIVIDWGDGSYSSVIRANGSGEILSNNTKKNIYISEHSYPGRNTYSISVMDPNRVDNILNIDPPNSVNIPFFLQTNVTLLNLQFQSPNHSVILLQAPVDFACVGLPFQHNPSAFDEDGDSLSFEFTIPLMDKNVPVPNYSFPNQIVPGTLNNIRLDSKTGTFYWDAPQKDGEYNVAFIIHEYRKGVRIASTIRDMQIYVRPDCKANRPPSIVSIFDTCIVAGALLKIPFEVFDPDTSGSGSKVKIEVSGAPFLVSPKMTVQAPTGYQTDRIHGSLIWETDCSLIRKEYYTLVLKATDDMFDSTGLSFLYTVRIKIVGPAPENLDGEVIPNKIKLNWSFPYSCDTSASNFRGFSVWRKEGPAYLPHDTCNPGLDNSSYNIIAYLVRNIQNGAYTYLDSTVSKGKVYCYRVQAEFAKLSTSGFPVNFVSSLHSNEFCGVLSYDLPLMLNVDVLKTDTSLGEIFLRWTKAPLQSIDTIAFPGPYTSIVRTKEKNKTDWTYISDSKRDFEFYQMVWDTIYTHSRLNTSLNQYQYSIEIQASNKQISSSDSADMLFLITEPLDRSIQLKWSGTSPWNNYQYRIFKLNSATGVFDSVGITNVTNYVAGSLSNDSLYCYYILSEGSYGISTVEHPLFNRSNISCTQPMDKKGPCCPTLTVSDPCAENLTPTGESIKNILKWNNPNLSCTEKDAIGYLIYGYYKGIKKSIARINDINQLSYEHTLMDEVPECYAITSFDKNGNECSQADTVCVAYCPFYKLPNTFTPNSDGHNDYYKAYPHRFIEEVDFKVFNRWGNLVFQTSDPDINWDGRDQSGSTLPDGTYFYTCLLNFSGLLSNINYPNQLNGSITIRGTNK